MKLDMSCPVEVRGYTLTYAGSKVEASVRMYNLRACRVASIEATAQWRCAATGKSVASPFSAGQLRAGGQSGFVISLSTDRLPDADGLDVLFTRVRFENGEEWRAGEGPFAEIGPLPAMDDGERAMLCEVAGADAVCYPEQTSRTWRCVCGRVNPNSADTCVRCHRDHFTAIGYTPDNVRFHFEAAAGKADGHAPEEADFAQMHARYLRQRTRLLRRTVLAAVVVLALTVLLALRVQGDETVMASPPATEMSAVDG